MRSRRSISRLAVAVALLRYLIVSAGRPAVWRYLRSLLRSRRLVELSLFLALPELRGTPAIARLARQVIRHRLYNDLDFDALPWRRYRVLGEWHLERALTQGRGAIVVSQHVGPYRRLFLELIARGHHVHLLVDARVFRFSQELERRCRRLRAEERQLVAQRLTMHNVEEPGSIRDVVAALSRNEVVLAYLDGNNGVAAPGGEAAVRANSVRVRFLGQEIAVRRGLAQIAVATGAPLVPAFAYWWRGRREQLAVIELEQPPSLDSTRGRERLYGEVMQELCQRCEARILEHPAQFEEWERVLRWRLAADHVEHGEPVELAAARRRVEQLAQVDDAKALFVQLDPKRALVLRVGKGELLVDAARGRLVPIEGITAATLRPLIKGCSLPRLVTRLAGRHPCAEVLEVLAHLEARGLLVASAGAAASAAGARDERTEEQWTSS